MSKSLWRSRNFNSWLKVVYLHIEDVWRTTLVLMPKRSKGNIVSSECRKDENGRSIVNSGKKFRLQHTFGPVNVIKGALVKKSFASAEAANDRYPLLLADEYRRTVSSTLSHADRPASDESNIKLLSIGNKKRKSKARKRKKKRYKIPNANDVLPICETSMADQLLPDGRSVEFATTHEAVDEDLKSCSLLTIADDRLKRKKNKNKKRQSRGKKQKYSLLGPFRNISDAKTTSNASPTERDIFKKVDVQSIRLKILRRKLSVKLDTAKSSTSSSVVAERDYAKLSLKELVDVESIRRKVFQRKLAERYPIAMSNDSNGNYAEDEIEKLININLEQFSNSAKKTPVETLPSDGNISVKEEKADIFDGDVKQRKSDVEECDGEVETNVNLETLELPLALKENSKNDRPDSTDDALRRSENSADENFGGCDKFSTSDMDISEDENVDDFVAYFNENNDISRNSEECSNEEQTVDVIVTEGAAHFFSPDRLNVNADVPYHRDSRNISNWRWNFRRWNTGYLPEMDSESCNSRDYSNSYYRNTTNYSRPCQNAIVTDKSEGTAENSYYIKDYRRHYDFNEHRSHWRTESSHPSDELNWRAKRTELCESNFARNRRMPGFNDNKYRNKINMPANVTWSDIAFDNNTLQRRTYSDIVKDRKNTSGKNNYNRNNSRLMNDIDLEQYVKDIRREVFTSYGQSIRNGGELGKRNEIGVFKVISYNVLAQTLLETYRDNLYRANNDEYLVWPYRKQVILDEIKTYDPDIICLQEVDMIHLDNFNEHFKELGFSGIYKKRTSEKPDGCAIYYRNSIFTLQEHTTIEYNQPQHRYLNRDNIGLVLRLYVNSLKKNIVVANTHLLYNPRRHDIRLSQVQILLAEIERVAFLYNDKNGDPVYNPVIIAGDFNSHPFSPVYDFITKGIMYYKGPEYENQLQHYPKFSFRQLPKDLFITDNCQHAHVVSSRPSIREKNDLRLIKLFNSDIKTEEHCTIQDCPNDGQTVNKEYHKYFDTGKIKHYFKLNSVYPAKLENGFATTRHDSWCMVDFIFYGPRNDGGESEGEQQLKLVSYLNLPTVSEATCMGPIPNKICGSDHLPLLATFHLVPS